MGFIRYALKYRLPVTPVVSTGAHETFFVLSRGEWIARKLKFSKYFRAEVFPLIAGLPFGIWIGTGIPQFPLPAKLTLQVLPPLSFPLKKLKDRTDPSLEKILRDENLLKHYFSQVRTRMQQGLDQLYAKRRFPILG